MKFILLIISFLFIENIAHAEILDKGNNFSIFVQNLDIVNMDFKQSKIIPNIKREFISSGKLKFEKNKGFIWHQHKPKDFKFTATNKSYCTNNTIKKLAEEPYFEEFYNLLDQLFSEKYDILYDTFDITYWEPNVDTWRLSLLPKIKQISKAFNEIDIIGNRKQILKIKINYTNGTQLTLDFFTTKVNVNDEIEC